MRPTAGNAALRPDQKASRSASFWLIRIERARLARAIASTFVDQVVDLDLRPVQFDDQQGLDIERIADVDESLGGMDRRAVHHLHAAGDDAGADDRGDAIAGILGCGEADQ